MKDMKEMNLTEVYMEFLNRKNYCEKNGELSKDDMKDIISDIKRFFDDAHFHYGFSKSFKYQLEDFFIHLIFKK